MVKIVVTNTNDSGAGSLRAAIQQASDNGFIVEDKIVFDASLAGQTIKLRNSLDIQSNLSIDGDVNGDGKADITVSGQNRTRVMDIGRGSYNDVTIRSLNITKGNSDEGAGIYARNFDSLKIVNSTISNCFADYGGGGLYAGADNGTVKVVNSLFTGNTAGYYGGAIRNNANMALINTTITGNKSVLSGAAGILFESGTLNLFNCTVTENHAKSEGIAGINAQGILNIINSVVADNTTGKDETETDIVGDVTRAINSIFGTDAVILAGGGNLENAGDIGLGDLLDNGGAILTLSPLDGSILIDFGNNNPLPNDFFDLDGDGDRFEDLPFDARLLNRIIDGVVDVGAVEQTDNETIFGTLLRDRIDGGEGRDFLAGLDGNDRMIGGTDRDLIIGGRGNDTMQGGGEHDVLKGGNGSDTLTGGSDKDTLAGHNGSDGFVLANNSGSQDEIVDFVSGTDQLLLLSGLFGNLALGALEPEHFVSNAKGLAKERDDRLIYDTTSGELFYDANGSRAGGSELIAVFNNLAAPQSSDFLVI